MKKIRVINTILLMVPGLIAIIMILLNLINCQPLLFMFILFSFMFSFFNKYQTINIVHIIIGVVLLVLTFYSPMHWYFLFLSSGLIYVILGILSVLFNDYFLREKEINIIKEKKH